MPLPTATDRNSFAQELFTPLPSRYDALAEVLSFGQNGRWRRAMVDRALKAAADRAHDPEKDRVILDVASGTAGVAISLARRSGAKIVGVDLTEQMLRRGKSNVAQAGQAERISLVAGRGEQLPFPDASFDALTFTYLLRYVDDPQATLTELARVVKPGGRIASLEFCAPPSPVWHAAWWLYTRTLLPAGGLLTGGRYWLDVGRFLGPNISAHYRKYPVDWTVDAWRKAGITDVGTRLMSLGGGLIMWGTRSGG
ncbi:MAG TPA: class I SAM-dependent methyltransferase [Streptosporangiaceae bacterium]|nr:class I SAM-dependent methyltransferase [Streptosporangiaceae bacterium]